MYNVTRDLNTHKMLLNKYGPAKDAMNERLASPLENEGNLSFRLYSIMRDFNTCKMLLSK